MIACATNVTLCANAGMLAQFGNRSFSLAIEWESAMRIIHEASGWVTKSDETPPTTAETVWSMHEVAAPRSRPPTMSRLMTWVVEGFAAYADAMHPCLADPGDDTARRTKERDPQAPYQTPDHRSEDWAHSSRPSPQVALRLQRDRIGSRIAICFGQLRFRRKNKAPIVRLDALDDRMRRDIGVDRHELEFWAEQMGPHEW
jgi:hypothetical protein